MISTAEAEILTRSHLASGRPGMSLGAGLVASSLLALGIVVGVVLTVVGRGEADPLYEKAVAYVDPSDSTGAAAAALPSAPLPPPFPVAPPVVAAPPVRAPAATAALSAGASNVFAPVVIGRPGHDAGSPVSVYLLPRAAVHTVAAKPAAAAAAPRTTRKVSPAATQSASTITAAPPGARPASKTGDAELDAAKQALSRAKAATADSL